ncbi:PEPxxWA-CTERM sorting domain-containing protein [Sphingomonas aliaeris]|uniref:PEPxxWA-CTERM sorting domain-containing protein n=2 Tax=Sphingomonas aliaeris TaxID=2759526 RepID=A0A974NYI2_9SPHN|nr:PEPxxWA-CTERM sorting domain-containing protein [Sphingomonas aliaeris]
MPYAPLVLDKDGNLFGTASTGGTNGRGTIFKVAAGTNAVSTVANFTNTTGYTPNGGLLLDDAGNLYGTTVNGGRGSGNVFRIDAGTSTITSIAEFGFGNPNPANPYSGLIMDAVGNLFGTTFSGGTSNNGTIFRIDAGTNAIVTLASFSGQPEGRGPYNAEGLVADAKGNLYGTTWRGGSINRGTVFRLSDAGFVTAAAAVPEPASWAMMMIGFGLLGGNLRRRRHSGIAVAA